MNTIIGKNKLSTIVDLICLGSIGIICFLYSIFWSTFAETHITLPFLDFPIFIGEILLFECVLLLILKWRIAKVKFNYKYYLLFLYVAWVLIRALHGYIEWGPLALRNAALFYYPLFAVIGYHFYRNDFFGQKTIIALFSILMISKMILGTDLIYYFITPYLLLSIVLILKMKQRWIKFAALGMLFIFFSDRNYFQGSRTWMVANFVILLFLSFSYIFGILKFRRSIKILSGVLFFLVLVLAFLKLAPPGKLKSLTTPLYVIEEIKRHDQKMKKTRANYIQRQIPAKVYHPNWREAESVELIEQERITREVRDKVLVIVEEIKSKTKKYVDNGSDQIAEQQVKQIVTEPATPEVRGITQQPKQSLEEKKDAYLEVFQSEREKVKKEVFSDEKESEISHWKINTFDNGFNAAVELSIDGLVHQKKVLFDRTPHVEYGNILFRVLIWRDMVEEVIRERAWLGVNLGKPQRSLSIEKGDFAGGEWGRDGWIAPHNAFLHMIYRAGVFGFLMVLSIMAYLFMMTKKFIKRKSLEGLFLVSILVYWLVIASFLVVLELPYQGIPFWTLFGMVLAYLNRGGEKINFGE